MHTLLLMDPAINWTNGKIKYICVELNYVKLISFYFGIIIVNERILWSRELFLLNEGDK